MNAVWLFAFAVRIVTPLAATLTAVKPVLCILKILGCNSMSYNSSYTLVCNVYLFAMAKWLTFDGHFSTRILHRDFTPITTSTLCSLTHNSNFPSFCIRSTRISCRNATSCIWHRVVAPCSSYNMNNYSICSVTCECFIASCFQVRNPINRWLFIIIIIFYILQGGSSCDGRGALQHRTQVERKWYQFAICVCKQSTQFDTLNWLNSIKAEFLLVYLEYTD